MPLFSSQLKAVLVCIAQCKTPKQTSVELLLSLRTVQSYHVLIAAKFASVLGTEGGDLGLNRIKLLHLAIRMNLAPRLYGDLDLRPLIERFTGFEALFDVGRLAALGLTNAEIAKERRVSERTVETQMIEVRYLCQAYFADLSFGRPHLVYVFLRLGVIDLLYPELEKAEQFYLKQQEEERAKIQRNRPKMVQKYEKKRLQVMRKLRRRRQAHFLQIANNYFPTEFKLVLNLRDGANIAMATKKSGLTLRAGKTLLCNIYKRWRRVGRSNFDINLLRKKLARIDEPTPDRIRRLLQPRMILN